MINIHLLPLSLILSAATLLGAEAPARTDFGPPSAAGAHLPATRMHSLIFAAIDFDRDGVLSAGEISHAPTALGALDLNDDGVLSSDELRRFELSQPANSDLMANREPRMGRVVSSGFILAFTLDANHDGLIQTMEMANAATSLIVLDVNGDGQLTMRELRPVTVLTQN